uniref:Macaca fascicularis brain cDNA clone: QflA-22160, similar to human discs, large homolog 4 (Drosophila) (DLG4), mRNA, RefSeq: NM_001365.1 n=1 Tax=Macaca fascicularis TaxID=9541 RepID=I7GHU2_MACFA|nr:unnamed protein product [Macaca fascicularis]
MSSMLVMRSGGRHGGSTLTVRPTTLGSSPANGGLSDESGQG